MFHCDIYNGTPGILNYRRCDGDIVCKTCREQYDCRYIRKTENGTEQRNEGGPSHPRKSDAWDGGQGD